MINYSKRRPSMNMNTIIQYGFKPNSAYFVSHNGLGDLLISTSAVRFLIKFYQTVFFICKSWHYNQLSMILSDEPRIKIISLEMNTPKEESNNIWDTLTNVYLNNDIFTCGHYSIMMHSKITNEFIRSYVPNNSLYKVDYDTIDSYNTSFIYKFYNTINLDLRIYYEYFNIPSTQQSRELYDLVKDYKRVIFTQIKCSGSEQLNIYGVKSKYIKDDDAIILCNDENLYEKETNPTKYAKSQQFVKNNIAWYIDTILNCNEIYILDSCFIAIVLPLVKTNRLKADVVRIIKRELVNEILL
jgi:hypothetical protein